MKDQKSGGISRPSARWWEWVNGKAIRDENTGERLNGQMTVGGGGNRSPLTAITHNLDGSLVWIQLDEKCTVCLLELCQRTRGCRVGTGTFTGSEGLEMGPHLFRVSGLDFWSRNLLSPGMGFTGDRSVGASIARG